MEKQYIWLIIGELLIIALVVIVKLIFDHLEKKKVNSILKFIDKKAKEKEAARKFDDCLEIINKCRRDENGKRN